MKKNKTVAFLLFENFFQKKDTGSSRIRGHWVIKNMPEAELFVQGKTYETIIFQKAYWKEMMKDFNGKKILDICDPDWLEGAEIITLSRYVDAITVSSKKLKEDLERMVEVPVYLIKDRVDFDNLPDPKVHEGRAKKVVWFGYSHNIDVLDPTFMKIKKLGLKLKVISDATFNTSECECESVKWDKETVDKEIQDADFVLMPEYKLGRYIYKSNNKTVHSWALGMPVAQTAEDMERYLDPNERNKEANKRYQEVRKEYDVKKSVEELRKIINSIKK